MSSATFNELLDANAIQVGAFLFMGADAANRSTFKAVILAGAKIAGNANMNGAAFDGDLDASGLQVGGQLQLQLQKDEQSKTSFKGAAWSVQGLPATSPWMAPALKAR